MGAETHFRPAVPEDADACADVLRRSIIALCAADHGDDPEFIAAWTANKTPGLVTGLIANPVAFIVAAEREGRIVGVGAGTLSGEITLNYVAPEARWSGVSKGLLALLEEMLADGGHAGARLTSTKTAHQFYKAQGYVDEGEPVDWRGSMAFPMLKALW